MKEVKDSKSPNSKRRTRGKGKKYDKSKDRNYKGKSESREESKEVGLIPMKDGDKNPNWYFTDKAMAEQVTQMSFQNLAGYPITVNEYDYDVPNVVVIDLNPCPGVIKSADYGSTVLNKTAGINLAGFKLFSELAAYTGRTAVYGPQDISTMILAMGEVISMTEFIRRIFGVAFTMNMRNRSYPRTVLENMLVDPDDLFTNYSDYRTRFNTLITMINQLPIPASIAYFDKCMHIYQEIYLDNDSSMAQTIFAVPFSTWELDESSYSGGTILKTVPVIAAANKLARLTTPQPLAYFLNILDGLIGALLNSSTLNVVYTDLLNLATKKGVSFLKMDFLSEGYAVVPRYSKEFMLQMHNATIVGAPEYTTLSVSPHVTPWNDVYPNANTNSLFYNPASQPVDTNRARTGKNVLVDMFTDAPDLVDRIESLRYTSIAGSNFFTASSQNWVCDATLPDHYVVGVQFWTPSQGLASTSLFRSTIVRDDQWLRLSTLVSNIDWAPRFYRYDISTHALTGHYTGDINYYTVIGEDWIRKVNQFVALALYDIR